MASFAEVSGCNRLLSTVHGKARRLVALLQHLRGIYDFVNGKGWQVAPAGSGSLRHTIDISGEISIGGGKEEWKVSFLNGFVQD